MVEDSPGSGVSAPTAPHWELCVLGGFRLTNGTGTEAPGFGKLDRALLAYLALNQQQRHPRVKLAELLWPDRTRALRSLSVSLNILRQGLGDKNGSLIGRGSDPVLCHFEGIDVDALTFEKLVSQGTPEALEKAAALYAGDLLDGLDLRSDEFDRWLAAERMRLNGKAVDCLCRLMRHREQDGLPQKAFETARRILLMDELCEDAHCTIMRLHLTAGQRAAARAQAQHCEQLLRREGFEPQPETARLIAECRQPGTGDSHPWKPTLPSSEDDGAQQAPMPPPIPDEENRGGTIHPPHPPAPRRWFQIAVSFFGLRIAISFFAAIALLLITSSVIVAENWTVPELAKAPLGRYVAWVKEQIWGIAARRPPRIAILPLESIGADPVAEEIAAGIVQGVTHALQTVSEMSVVANYSVLPFEKQQATLQQIARQLDVRYLLQGSVQKSANSVRIRVSLTDAQQGGEPIWSEAYHREVTEIFALQDEITWEIITNVQVSATAGEKERIEKSHGTDDLQAWLLAGRAQKLLQHVRREDNAAAQQLYLQATQRDPDYSGAWDGLAWTYLLAARFGWSSNPEADIGMATQHAQTALRLDTTRGRTHSLLGTIRLLMQDFDQAEELGVRAVQLEPGDADAAALLAHSMTYMGEPGRAIQLINRAMRQSPYYPDWYGWVLARANRLAGDYEGALAALAKVNSTNAESVAPLVELILIYAEMGEAARAKAAAEHLLEIVPDFSVQGYMRMPPYKDPRTRDTEIGELLRAGLPE
jgi:TolB-like protein/DNA-binding SARP family transcriptional activator